MLVRLIVLCTCFTVFPALSMTTSTSHQDCEVTAKNDPCSVLYRQLKRLVRYGSPEAATLLAFMHMYGEQGIEKDPQKAIRLLTKAARKNASVAQFELAIQLFSGEHIEADPERAMSLIEDASIRGYAPAALVYHMILIERANISPEDKLSHIEQIKALDLDTPEHADFFVGRYYLQEGQQEVAYDYLRKASDAGHIRARQLLKARYPEVEFSEAELQQLDIERIEVTSSSIDFVEAAREIINYAKLNSMFDRRQTGSRIPGRACEFDKSCWAINNDLMVERFFGFFMGRAL